MAGRAIEQTRALVPVRKVRSQMKYAQEVLGKSWKFQGKRALNKRFVDVVTCAYCRGSGVDPKYGNTSRCPVCSGAGEIRVTPPVVTCLKCSGSGREGGDLTCLACKGTGVVSVRKEAGICPKCKGTGEEGVFYCSLCKGLGIL